MAEAVLPEAGVAEGSAVLVPVRGGRGVRGPSGVTAEAPVIGKTRKATTIPVAAAAKARRMDEGRFQR